jgi:hypothetical protein
MSGRSDVSVVSRIERPYAPDREGAELFGGGVADFHGFAGAAAYESLSDFR